MVDIYDSEQEQVEAIKRWWQENGRSIIVGLILGVSALFAWNGWNSYVEKRNQNASLEYFKVVQAMDDNKTEQASTLIDGLVEKYSGTHYASLAQMMGAKLDAENEKADSAIKRLQWVAVNSKQDAFQNIARLRLAELYVSQSAFDKASSVLSKVKGAAFSARVNELKGDVALGKGNTEEAKTLYSAALPQATNKLLLQMKLDDLGGLALDAK